jgi:5,5'-dehydrodivanillate O-demethylase
VRSCRIDLKELGSVFTNSVMLVNAQDYVAQVGQGRIVNRKEEHLGRSDVGVVVLRKIWERELRAFAEGRPLKNWRYSEDLVVSYEDSNDAGCR